MEPIFGCNMGVKRFFGDVMIEYTLKIVGMLIK